MDLSPLDSELSGSDCYMGPRVSSLRSTERKKTEEVQLRGCAVLFSPKTPPRSDKKKPTWVSGSSPTPSQPRPAAAISRRLDLPPPRGAGSSLPSASYSDLRLFPFFCRLKGHEHALTPPLPRLFQVRPSSSSLDASPYAYNDDGVDVHSGHGGRQARV
jgi:hypothetical protein